MRRRPGVSPVVIPALPTQPRTKWTPRSVLCAIHEADTGTMRELADLCESVMVDERVAGVLASQTYGLIGRDMHVTGNPIQAIALEGLEGRPGDFPKMCPEGELERLIAWGRVMGIGYARKEYPAFRAIGEREVPFIRTWHPRYLRYEFPRPGLTHGRLWAMTATGEVEVKPENGWIVYMPYGKYRFWAFALWRALSFAWIIKQLAILDRARYSEVSGQPVRVGIAPQGATERARKRWQAALQALSADSAMVLPEGYDFKLVEASSTNYEVFQQAIDWADKAITITIKGEQVTTEGSSGFSNGDNQADVSNAILAFVEKSISSCLNEQLIAEWSRFNFVGNERCYLGWEITPSEDELKKAQSLDTLGKALQSLDTALKPSGFRLDGGKIVKEMGLPTIPLAEVNRTVSIQLAPTDVARVVRVNEARTSQGLPPLEDERGDLFISELETQTAPGAGPPVPNGLRPPELESQNLLQANT